MDCENCKYFIRHYVIHKHIGVMSANCGHCMLEPLRNKSLKKCTYFEEVESENIVNEKTLSIFNTLERVRRACDRISKELRELTNTIKN